MGELIFPTGITPGTSSQRPSQATTPMMPAPQLFLAALILINHYDPHADPNDEVEIYEEFPDELLVETNRKMQAGELDFDITFDTKTSIWRISARTPESP